MGTYNVNGKAGTHPLAGIIEITYPKLPPLLTIPLEQGIVNLFGGLFRGSRRGVDNPSLAVPVLGNREQCWEDESREIIVSFPP